MDGPQALTGSSMGCPSAQMGGLGDQQTDSGVRTGATVALCRLLPTELARLDTYLTYPRSVLPHVLVSRANAFAWADFGWGVAVFLLFCPRALAGTGVFLVSVLCVTMILCGLMVLVGALGFWILRSQAMSEQVMTAMIHFVTWPQSIYRPEIRIILCTLLPAVLIGSVPVNLVRSFSWSRLGLLAGAGVVFLVLGSLVFRLGLRRYESGNRIIMMG